ncbi:hypothetical protein OG500_02370 [Kitasatospora sp. NBC_01250]|uniref:hypothetical protein n=1 Tax=unclassified Kitasatospora TaxID=2633591 RepID=UPI002E0DD8F3|nr:MULTISPECIES: hypothetical protein [unclassified Kitasatospora]WSJ65024.1 hypothetical protein OG294_02290 [Kitasatospora sp. NBC_01302]
MPVDPSDPDVFQEDDDAAELPQETPEADAAEQHTDLRQDSDDPLTRIDPDAANEADAAEQARVVELDEDDYR